MTGQKFPIIELGVAIEEGRKAAGLSRSRVGQIVGVSGKTIERWENGETLKARDKLRGTAEALGTTEHALVARAYELAGREPPATPPVTGEERLGEMIAELRDGQVDMIGRLARIEELLEGGNTSESQPGNSDGSHNH